MKMNINEALKELRKEENKRKFEQSVDLIFNLKGFDIKRDNLAVVVNVPNKIVDKKVAGFLTKKSELVDSILEPDFAKYKDKDELKKLVDKYDFFVSFAGLMPKVATTFGKVLGPAGKMPSPQLGILTQENEGEIKEVLARIEKSVKIRPKEPSIKIRLGREKMKDEEIVENFEAVYKAIVDALPAKKDNIKNVLIKFTMSKPVKLEAK
jgi:large subunit ribosomal protein L1